ncbi:flagellar biosynthesis protein FliO [Bradyrhizobium sp. KBS0727]|uniref:flagellar biosynthetic protein FliO n=1 Tax=unclassified Bradyrhizobium TaxID=2631580 RepID=UPI00110D5F59|nr:MULTISPECIES: flagellar biosynthetic protein FliO [unclassified Bradyrhizobium]QDW39648.1 flagellar biosynthesis protein FliO [Bradyrhizobium sp. KBS0725]QDW46251.1 flagellar biosynthesis protein FliO [Bradyrhizobium sp. KBS0727]
MQTLTFLFAFIAVLALIGVAAWLVRRFATNRLGANTNRSRMPRLAVIDAAAVDGRRRLVLVRRDNVEHLLMIGGPSDIVVEPNIVRAMPGRDQMAPRPAVAGEAPPRIAPLPDANWNEEAARSDLRSADAYEHHAEPQMPEPPPRPARPSFADEVRRPAPMPERRSDPLAGFAPEPMGNRSEPVPPRLSRTEPLMPRPQRASELPKAPPPVRAPERAAAPPPPATAPAQSSADQNLAEMAQRLEAALRRPAEPAAPPVAPEPPRAPRADAPAPAPQKSGFENLEDEMASLLGRPKSPS